MLDPDAIPDSALPALEALLDHLRACQKRREQVKQQAGAAPTAPTEQPNEPLTPLYSNRTAGVMRSKR
jgi:hypothetical protein